MKKLVLSIAVIAGMSLFACGSSEKQAEAAEAEAAAPVEEVVEEAAVAVDSITPDSANVVVEEAAAAVAE